MPKTQMKIEGELRSGSPARADIRVFDIIGDPWDGVTDKQFAQMLDDLGDVDRIDVTINSQGGVAMDALAMFNMLVEHPARVNINVIGGALSAASILMLAGDTRRIADNAFVMIHRAWTLAIGNADELIARANMLKTIDSSITDTYANRTNLTAEEIPALLDAETWYTAAEAVDAGFATEKGDAVKAAASFDITDFRNTPQRLIALNTTPPAKPKAKKKEPNMPTDTTPKAATPTEIRTACPGATAEFVLNEIERGSTTEQSVQAYATVLAESNAAKDAEILKLKADAEKATAAAAKNKGAKPGAPVIDDPDAVVTIGNARAQWLAHIDAKLGGPRKLNRSDAVRAVNKENPGLREQMLRETPTVH